MLKYFFVCTTAIIFMVTGPAWADIESYNKSLGGSGEYTPFDYEFSGLPSYCICKLKKEENRTKKEKQYCDNYREKVKKFGEKGKDFLHAHHYCAGLLMLSRFYRGVGERAALLGTAESHFRYVIGHSSQKFILMPEVLLNMGRTKKLLGKDDEAARYFSESIQLKKNYIPAYIQLSDLYIKHKKYKNALSIIQLGLKHSPDTSILKQKLSELKSYIQ